MVSRIDSHVSVTLTEKTAPRPLCPLCETNRIPPKSSNSRKIQNRWEIALRLWRHAMTLGGAPRPLRPLCETNGISYGQPCIGHADRFITIIFGENEWT